MNLDSYLIPHIKVNFREVMDFSVKSKTIKLIEENIKKIFMPSKSATIFEKSQKNLKNQKIK